MLEKGFGLSREIIHRATAQETIYQIVSRTSLRLFDSTEPVHAIVPDRATAQRLVDLYGSKQVSQLGSLFEQATPSTRAENQRRYRERLKAAKGKDLTLASVEPPTDHDNTLAMTVTACDHYRAKAPEEFSQYRGPLAEFVAYLREQSRRKLSKKEEALFNLSVFEPPEGSEHYRRLVHFKSAGGLVLDFDNGEVSPEEFERIFWKEAGRGRKISFIIMNTFSRSETRPDKFRVIIPFRRPVESKEEYHAAYDYVTRRIEERGHRKPPKILGGPNLDVGGLDRSSRSPTQMFYWPCTNAAHPEAAFFRSCGLQRRKLERYALDPHKVAKEAPTPSVAAPTPPPAETVDQGKVEAAIRQWREVGCGAGCGNHEFFLLGLRLHTAGMPDYEIERTLGDEAQYARTPSDRRRNIPFVMLSLRRRGGEGFEAVRA